MDPTRLDTISRLFAGRTSRRAAIGGGLGLAGAALTAGALAQDGTPQVATPAIDPSDPHPSADGAQPNPEFLFVQPFDSGTWAPKTGEDGVYTLTLTGAAAHTVYFSDRPERIVGLVPTDTFLDTLGFTPANPPNAAIVAPQDDGTTQDILVIELLNPVYDADAGTLTYDAKVLAEYGEPGLAHLAQQQTDYELSETFGSGGLFIDDCPSASIQCIEINVTPEKTIGNTQIAQHFDNSLGKCLPNRDPMIDCADAYPDQCKVQDYDYVNHRWVTAYACKFEFN